MKKKILFLIIILTYIINLNAQKIEKNRIIDIVQHKSKPFILIESNFDKSKNQINFLFWKKAPYSICRRPTYYNGIYEFKGEKKMYLYKNEQLVSIEQTKINLDNLETKNFIETFHPYFDLKKDESVYFSPNKNKSIKGIIGIPGDLIKHNEKEITSVFPDLSSLKIKKINEKIYFTFVKNTLKVLKYEKNYKFNIHEGWKIQDKDKLLHKTDIPDLNEYSPMSGNSKLFKNKFILQWLKNKKNKSLYKFIFYNPENDKLVVKNFDFKVPRKLISGYNFVFDENLKPRGILAIFGYHKKGKKQKDIYPENRFDFIYMDLNGNEILNTKIDYGTEKDYKKTFMPVFTILKPSGDLLFLNSHKKSLVKYDLEVFSLNKQGQLKLNSKTSKSKDAFDKTMIYYYREISNAQPFKFKNYYVFEGVVVDKIYDDKQKRYLDNHTGIYDIILNKNLEVINVNMNFIQPNNKGKIIVKKFNKDKEIALFEKNNEIYLRKLIVNDNKPNVIFKNFKFDFDKDTENNFFGKISLKDTYLNEEKKEIYFTKLFFSKNEPNKIEKIGIIDIKY